jgi:hemerythrin
MLIGKHMIVHIKEWKTIINALDILEVLLKSKHEELITNINVELLESLQAHFNAEEVSKLSDKISTIR